MAAALLGGGASAQTVAPSRVTPEDLRPAPAGSGALSLPGAQGLQAPPNAAALSATIGGVVVDGDFDEMRETTRALARGLEHRRATLAEIYALANAIEQAYSDAGFPLARVALPAQQLKPGAALRLVVVDGAIEDIDVSAVPERQRAVVKARLAPLIGKRHVRIGEVERRLLLAADVPALALRSTLTAGRTPGGSLLVLQATHQFVTGSLGVENYLPRTLGPWATNTSLALNSAFGFGEQAYFSASLAPDLMARRLRLLGGGVSIPLGIDGLSINPEFTRSSTRPIPAPGAPPSEGAFDRFDLRASYPLIRSRAHTLTLQATWEWAKERLTPLAVPVDTYLDRYTVARLQLADQALLPWGGTAQAVLAFSQGLEGRAGTPDVPLSSANASARFRKLTLDARMQQPLPLESQLSLIARAQTSFGRPLFVSEQFGLDGPDAASGFASGLFSVDQGFSARGEWSRPFALPTPDAAFVLAPYVFGAGARGFLAQATAVQAPAFSVASFGLGARLYGSAPPSNYGGALALELARALTDDPAQRDGWRFNLSASLKF